MNSTQLASILLRNSTNRYYIVYQGYLVNHLSHGIVALSRLGANCERIERFIEWYIPRLEEPEKFRDEENVKNITELLGKRQSFYGLVNAYKEELETRDGSLEKLIADKFPTLFPGLLGAALHGLIHLGYGYAARSAQVVCEGLAYMHYSYLPIKLSATAASRFTEEEIGRGPYNVLDAVAKVRDDVKLRDFMKMKAHSEEFLNMNVGDFSRKAMSLFTFRGDEILDFSLSVQIPSIDQIEQLDVEFQCWALLRWLLETAVAVYALADVDDFFLLHGVTAAWSLLQVGPVVVGHSKRLAQDLVKTFLCALLTAYIAQDCPPLSTERLKLLSYKEDVWTKVIEAALADDKDEHVYKLVQVCHELANDTDDQNVKKLCLIAGIRAINETFVF